MPDYVEPKPVTVSGLSVRTVMAPWDDYTAAYIDLLKTAQKTIHVMTFAGSHSELIETLIAKQQSGVQVHLIQDYQQYAKLPFLQQQMDRLVQAGVDVVVGTAPILPKTPEPRNQTGKPFPCPAGWALHSKVIVVDGQWISYGSGNQSYGAPKECNSLSIMRSPELAAQFLFQFDEIRAWILANQQPMQPGQMSPSTPEAETHETEALQDSQTCPGYQQGDGVVHENVTVTSYLAPEWTLGNAFVDAIEKTTRSLYLWVFEITHKKAMALILEKAQQGVAVFVIQDKQSYGEFSDIKDWIDQLQAAGAQVTIRSSPCQGTFMHMKSAVFDEASVWDGSWNPTYSGLWESNTGALFESKELATYYIAMFNKLKSAPEA